MDGKFDIIEYMSGLTGYIFTKAVLQRIALERGVDCVTDYNDLTPMMLELLFADLLYTAYCSPNVMASASRSHSGMSNSVGSQQIYEDFCTSTRSLKSESSLLCPRTCVRYTFRTG